MATISLYKSIRLGSFKCSNLSTFNATRVLKKNDLSFCLHKTLKKCRVPIRKSLIITEKIRTRKILKLTESRSRRNKNWWKIILLKINFANNKKIKNLLCTTTYIMKKRWWKKAINRKHQNWERDILLIKLTANIINFYVNLELKFHYNWAVTHFISISASIFSASISESKVHQGFDCFW